MILSYSMGKAMKKALRKALLDYLSKEKEKPLSDHNLGT